MKKDEDIEFNDDNTIYGADTIESDNSAINEYKDKNQIDELEDNDSSKTVKKEMIIYLVIDRPVNGIINYFRECGVNISNVYTSVEQARSAVLMQSEPCRIVVADTGIGKFTTTKTRSELIDMIGICDENNKVTMFYTDSAIKMDTLRKQSKLDIDWFNYRGTADMVAKVLMYNEKYKLDSSADDNDRSITREQLNTVKGLSVSISLGEPIVVRGLSSDNIVQNMLESNEGVLQKYNITV